MKMKLITAAALVAAFAMPAFAAGEFYLVQNPTTKECSIVEAMPTDSSMALIGAAHSTQADAEAAMKEDKSCVAK